MLVCYFVCGVACYFGISAMNFIALGLAFLAGFVYIVGVMCGIGYFNNTPNIVYQMPLSPKKALLYRFLSILILFIALVIFLILFMLVIGLITGGIILIIDAINSSGVSGEVAGEVAGDAEEISMMTPMGVHGGIFAAAYFVFMYGTGMIAGFIKDSKKRMIFVVCQSLAVLGGMALMRNPFIQESYVKMAVPWLCTALCILAAIAALGTAIYMGIKQYNKSY